MKIRRTYFSHRFTMSLFIILSALVLSPVAGLAEESRGPEKAYGPKPGWSTFMQGGYVHQFDSDLDEGGNFNTDRLFLQGGVTHANENGSSVSLTLGYGYDGYDFSGTIGFAGLRPWDDVHSWRFSVPIRYKHDAHWSWFVIPTIRSDAESGADFGDSISGGGFAGFSYRFSDRLTIGPGIGVISQIEDDVSVFPVLIINWKITDRLSLDTGSGVGATLGPGLTLNWNATDALTLSLGGRYERLRFRLDNDGVAEKGVGDDQSFPVFGAVSYKFSPRIQASLIGGFETGGELRLEDEKGNILRETDYDTAGFLGFSFNCRF